MACRPTVLTMFESVLCEEYRIMSEKFNRCFGLVLRQARNRSGLTQQELSEKTGVQRGFLSDVETGKKGVSLEKFLQICAGLRPSTPEQLLTELQNELKSVE